MDGDGERGDEAGAQAGPGVQTVVQVRCRTTGHTQAMAVLPPPSLLSTNTHR